MPAALKAIDRPQSLADRVYEALREHICSDRVAAGEPLREPSLAAMLGVSRTPVREALGRLASEGLVASDGRSFVVPALDEADIDDIYELRLLLEPAALRDVAARMKDTGVLQPLHDELATMRRAHEAGDASGFIEANYRYRAAWLGLLPNRRLLRAIELYADHVRYLRHLTLGNEPTRAVVLRGLERIAAALAARDAEAADAAMREHLLQAKRYLSATLPGEAARETDLARAASGSAGRHT